ncbi:4-hydroxyphenylacetate 3-hydroxylase N-terminal domain-containing protein [Moorella naiadis]|uniref:4-hydroxyphenylacetate 3-hydroxylase N-terminal domain-containing protein n=1 Tax=Moorella naiadis (nom. illeg.) TaxID=3093670 RepID=UPI003D9CACC8
MALRTAEEYIKGLGSQNREVYIHGEKVTNYVDHPCVRPVIESVALTFEKAFDPEFENWLVKDSDLVKGPVNRFLTVHKSQDDLVGRVQLLKMLTPQHGACVGARCVGQDAIHAAYITTYDIDKKYGTNYHERFCKWLAEMQEKDLAVSGMVTDSKADRSLRPEEQEDPDSYLHVVQERKDGIVVRGAKAHQSGALVADEHLVLPTETIRPEGKQYAIAFAVPADTPGIIHIYESPAGTVRRLLPGAGEMDFGNATYGVHGASLVIFNDVFIPWERVFMYQEADFSTEMVEYFARMHRLAFCGCKAGHCDILLGACMLAVEYIGLTKASHIWEKLVTMFQNSELSYGCAIGAARLGYATPSGGYMPDVSLTNAAKLQGGRAVAENANLAMDIGGGLLCTIPTQKDWENGEIREYINKYFRGKAGISTENRIRISRLIEYLMGQSSVIPAESILGGGPPETQRVMLRVSLRQRAGWMKERAKVLAGIKE